MSQIKNNGDGTVTMPEELARQLILELNTTKKDVEGAVLTIAKMLQLLGIIQKDGTVKEDFRFRDLWSCLNGIVRDAMFNSKGLEKKFGFIKDPHNLIIIEKYSYLYRESAVKKEKTILDLEFEKL